MLESTAVTEARQGLYKIVGGRQDARGPVADYERLEVMCDMVEEDVELDGVELKNVEMTASRTNNVVKTAINGRKGTIKEFVSEGDVAIGMTVKLLSEDNEYPWAQVQELKTVLKKHRELKVVSRWLNTVWDVTRVAVESYQMSGHTERNFEEVELNLVSDEEYSIYQGEED